jgi:hypothetical protein
MLHAEQLELVDACRSAQQAVELAQTLGRYLRRITRRLEVGDITAVTDLNKLTVGMQYAISLYSQTATHYAQKAYSNDAIK